MSSALRLTAGEYDRMVQRGAFEPIGRRIELIRGELREMSPAGPVHDELIAYLAEWSYRSTHGTAIQVRVQSGLDLEPQDSRPEPDLLWVARRRYFEHHPRSSDVCLAVEVAESSLKSDLTEKAALYAEAGIPEYWVVDKAGPCIVMFRSPSPTGYQQRRSAGMEETIQPQCLPAARLQVAALFGPSG